MPLAIVVGTDYITLMDERSPQQDGVVVAQKDTTLMGACLRRVKGALSDLRWLQRRRDQLVLFKERHAESNDAIKPISTIKWKDRPETEILFDARDEILSLDVTIRDVRALIDRLRYDPATTMDGLTAALEKLVALGKRRDKLMERIQAVLLDISQECARGLLVSAKMLSDGAKLARTPSVRSLQDGPELRDLPDHILEAQIADADGG